MAKYNFNDKSSNLVGVFIAIGAILILIALLFYWSKFGSTTLSDEKDDWNLFSQYFGGVIGPIISILTLVITAWIAIKFNDYQIRQQKISDSNELQQTTIELFKEFRSDKLRFARDNAWEVKKKWDADTEGTYRKQYIKSMIKEQEFDDGTIKIKKDEFKGVYDLFAFYIMLGLYSNNETNIRNLNYFYYEWWRKFLCEIAIEYDKLKKFDISNDTTLDDKTKFSKNDFLDNISLTRPLVKLDQICGFDSLEKEFHLYINNG
jgi:hypothetical protein